MLKIIKINKYNIWPNKYIEVQLEKNNKNLYLIYSINKDMYGLYNKPLLDNVVDNVLNNNSELKNKNMLCLTDYIEPSEMNIIIKEIDTFQSLV